MRSDEAFPGSWYYSLELAPGLYTEGREHQNIVLTRDLLDRVDVEGERGSPPARCLDIGTMEGLVPILLERRGASSVIAYDRSLLGERLRLVQRALGLGFDLVGDLRLGDLRARLAETDESPPYDLVVFSGVMYHMFDPLAGLAIARGLTRDGGILLVETQASFDEGNWMHFNEAARMAPNTIWVPSIPSLDYMLRFLRLEAIDVTHLGPWEKEDTPTHGRIAVACRAKAEAPVESGDSRIGGEQTHDDLRFAEYIDWDEVASDLPDLAYRESDRALVRRESGTVDLLATTRANDPHPVTDDQVRLSIDALR